MVKFWCFWWQKIFMVMMYIKILCLHCMYSQSNIYMRSISCQDASEVSRSNNTKRSKVRFSMPVTSGGSLHPQLGKGKPSGPNGQGVSSPGMPCFVRNPVLVECARKGAYFNKSMWGRVSICFVIAAVVLLKAPEQDDLNLSWLD